MPRMLFWLWLTGVLLLIPVVVDVGNFFVREHGPLAGRMFALLLWVFIAALTHFLLRVFVGTFLQK
jgi:hypothetical protein